MDFRVYHYGARGVFDGTRPVYGPTSGMGWPMHYRYPPLFLLVFAPLAWLPLGLGSAVWVVLKAVVLVLLVRAITSRLSLGGTPGGWLLPTLLAGPYVVEEFRYGNAQFFVFALAAVGLLDVRKRPMLSAASLALSISLKVWPLFFVPYLAVRRDWKVVSWTLVVTAILTMLPSLYFGFGGNLHLLAQWFGQEFSTQLGESEIWFPNQSLRGVLMRYLTVIDYSQVPDSNYPLVHIAALDPAIVRAAWLGLAMAAYAGLLVIARRGEQSEGWIEHGLTFCMIGLLEPFTQKYALVVLLWPAIVAGMLATQPSLRNLIYAAVAAVIFQPLIPGAATQRLLQVLGFDFAATVVLTAAMTKAALSPTSKLGPAGSCK